LIILLNPKIEIKDPNPIRKFPTNIKVITKGKIKKFFKENFTETIKVIKYKQKITFIKKLISFTKLNKKKFKKEKITNKKKYSGIN